MLRRKKKPDYQHITALEHDVLGYEPLTQEPVAQEPVQTRVEVLQKAAAIPVLALAAKLDTPKSKYLKDSKTGGLLLEKQLQQVTGINPYVSSAAWFPAVSATTFQPDFLWTVTDHYDMRFHGA